MNLVLQGPRNSTRKHSSIEFAAVSVTEVFPGRSSIRQAKMVTLGLHLLNVSCTDQIDFYPEDHLTQLTSECDALALAQQHLKRI
jgi:hypothetical protein